MRSRTRRELLRDGATLAAAGVLADAPALVNSPALAAVRPRRRPRRRVAVIGGGVAGMTAAHELAERGFEVTVYERRALGGKARSFGVPGSARGGRRPLPAEHGARFVPGLYQNLPDTMRRIPFPGNPGGTFGNVVTANQDCYARSGGRSDFTGSYAPTDPYPWTFDQFRQTLIATLELATRLPTQEVAYFVDRLLVFFTSCDARRFGQWEHESWWDYVSAERFSEDYRRMLVSCATRFVLGSKASEACARTLGLLWEAGIYDLLGRYPNGPFDQVLSLPTNEAFIDPWAGHLRQLGVSLQLGAEVQRLQLRGSRVSEALVQGPRGRDRVEADWFVLAVPVERARRLLGGPVLAADQRLAALGTLETRWMNGLQLYLREPTPIVRGHVLYVDAPWALSSISQAQFWPERDFARDYGDGTARDCMSIDISDFTEPGTLFGKPARTLQPEHIVRDAWEQMKAHLNDTGQQLLRDDLLVRWYLDPALKFGPRGVIANDDPLFISTPGAWASRPDVATAIPNLFLAADYVRVNIDTASMEGANEAGRRATNALLAAADSPAAPAAIYDLYRPPEFEPFRAADEKLWALGLPNALDAPPPRTLSLPALAHLPG
ncbi:MAG TPA: FAD-dependent oxidoreductase [Solirubrobacteraceae bacterium]|jgi:uncharacterized protein with NAD-binding domain and iron-sulfur cluster|nr:FAD-dependent oxidoreductase [Solirubrobacteraceae bacterium]